MTHAHSSDHADRLFDPTAHASLNAPEAGTPSTDEPSGRTTSSLAHDEADDDARAARPGRGTGGPAVAVAVAVDPVEAELDRIEAHTTELYASGPPGPTTPWTDDPIVPPPYATTDDFDTQPIVITPGFAEADGRVEAGAGRPGTFDVASAVGWPASRSGSTAADPVA